MTDNKYIASLQIRISSASDEEAYKKLFYHFHPLLRRFAYNLTDNAEVSEEIVSDVLLKIWTMRDKISVIQDIKLYLFKSTKNNCLNYLNSAARKKVQVTEAITDAEVFTSPESEYIYSEMQELILTIVAALPEKCQMVFRLVKEYGLSYAQVGEIMNISQNTIETHMRLALKKLKLALDSYRELKK